MISRCLEPLAYVFAPLGFIPLKGLNPEDYGDGSFIEGQILYDEFVDWEQKMMNEMREKNENKKSEDMSS